MRTTRLNLVLEVNREVAVPAVADEQTPPGLWVHRTHNDDKEWRISHQSGVAVMVGFQRRSDALAAAARLGTADWDRLDVIPVAKGANRIKLEILSNFEPYEKAFRLAAMKFPPTRAKRGGRRWRVAL